MFAAPMMVPTAQFPGCCRIGTTVISAPLEVKLVSNETSKGINHAVNAVIEHRAGMDVLPGCSQSVARSGAVDCSGGTNLGRHAHAHVHVSS